MSLHRPFPFADTERLIRAANTAHDMNMRCQGMGATAIIDLAARHFGGRLTLVSSFGADSAVLLYLAAQIDRSMAVTFVDTGRLFGETLRYRDHLTDFLGLTNVQTISPDPVAVKQVDADQMTFERDPNLCCYWRKVEPLQRALHPYDAWITGRKRHQSDSRNRLGLVEAVDGRVKFNPLAEWRREDLKAFFETHDLPPHPLESDGFLSIGCMPCTDRVRPGEDERAGRWRDLQKTECGIHTI